MKPATGLSLVCRGRLDVVCIVDADSCRLADFRATGSAQVAGKETLEVRLDKGFQGLS